MAEVTKEITTSQILDCGNCDRGIVVEVFNPANLASGGTTFEASVTECCKTYQFTKDCCNTTYKNPTGTKLTIAFDDSVLAVGVSAGDINVRSLCCIDACYLALKELIAG